MLKVALVALATMLPATMSAYDFVEGGIYYEKNGNEVSVTRAGENVASYSGDVVIPEAVVHDGVEYAVTAIGYSAFSYCYSLTSIEMAAFYWCSGLTEIIIPAGVTSIDTGAFFLCTGLTSVEIPASVVSLSAYSFARCENLASVTIYNPEMEIGDSDCDVFDSCAAGLVIHGCDPSTAKTYAEAAGIAFEPLSEAAGQ